MRKKISNSMKELKENKRDLHLIINDVGDVILNGCDSGPFVKKYSGDFDYKYSLTIKQENLGILNEKLIKTKR